MASFLDKLDGSSERWLRQFWGSLDASRKKRETEIEKARIAGLKDQVKRLEALNKFWTTHPELEALSILRAQNPEGFDAEYPEHANLKEITPQTISEIFMKGNKAEMQNFEARVANPATRRIAIISDIKSNPAKYGENAYERFKHLIPGGDAESLRNYALNQKRIDQGFDNGIAHARAMDDAKVKYEKQLKENPNFLNEMMSPDYLARKDAIDTAVAKRAAISDKIAQYKTYYDPQNPWTRHLGQQIQELEGTMNQSWKDPSVLRTRETDEAISRAGTIIPQMQQNVGRAITNVIRTREPDVRTVFNSDMVKRGYPSDQATLDRLWGTYGGAIKENWESEKTDLRATQRLMRAFAKSSTDPNNAAERMQGLESYVSSIIDNHVPDLAQGAAAVDPDKYKNYKDNVEKELNIFEESKTASGAAETPISEEQPAVEEAAPERAGQTALFQPDHVLETLSLYGIHVWPTAVYRRKAGAMPGALGNAEPIPEEELPIVLGQFFAARGMPPELTDYALRKVNQYAMGVDPHQILA